MKNVWKWLWILGFGLVAFVGGWLLKESWVQDTIHLLSLIGIVSACAFASLTMLLGKKNQLAVTAFIFNGFYIWFCGCYVVECGPKEWEVLLAAELGLIIYIFVLLLGEKYLDWLVGYAAIDGNDDDYVEEKTVAVFDLDKWLADADIFLKGACAMLLVLEVLQMLSQMRVYSFGYTLLGTLGVCHVATFLLRNPGAKKWGVSVWNWERK